MKFFFVFFNHNFQKRLLGLVFLLFLYNNGFSQTLCRPSTQTNSTGGLLCVGMSVTNPDYAFDANKSSYASLTNAVGLLCFAQETLTFNQTAKAGDQIVIYFGTGNGLLDLGLLSNATIQAKNNGTNVGTAVALNNALLNLQLLPGNEIAVIKYTLTEDANQIKIQVGGLLSLLVNLRIYDVHLDFAKPTISGGLAQTICSGNTATLTATPAAGTTIEWYSSAISTILLATTNTFVTPLLTADTTYYIATSRLTGCEGSERLPVVINVLNPVPPAINTLGTAVCLSGATEQTTLSVINPVPGTTYNWYSTASGGTILGSGNTYSPTVSNGLTYFYVEAAIGSCVSLTRTQVTVTSTPVPAVPTVLTQSVTIQSGQNAILTATTTEPNVTLNWYDVPTAGIAIANNTSSFTTPILTASKTYYVEAESATADCPSIARVAVTVTVVATVLGNCLDANSQQTNTNALCLLCGVTNPNNSVDGNINTAARLSVPIGLLNGWIEQTLQFDNPGKAGDSITVELGLPGGILDVGLLNYISLATYNSATFNDDSTSIDNLLFVQLLGGNRFKASMVAGATFDRIQVRLGGLANVLTSLDIYNASYNYKKPTITGNTTICNGETTTLTAGIAIGETIAWYDAATGGNLLTNTTSYTTLALTASTIYYVEMARNGCIDNMRLPIQVIVNHPVAPILDTLGTTICSGQSTILTVANPVAGTNYKWYDAAILGNLLFTGTSFVTPILSTNKSYYIEAEIGSCTSATRTPATVIVNPLPAPPVVVVSDIIIQNGQSALLQVSSPETEITFDWYDVATGGTALTTNSNVYATANLTFNKTYYVTARNTITTCESATRAVINVIVNNPIGNCLQATSQFVSDDGSCSSCGHTDDTFSVDGNNDTAAHLTIGSNLTSNYIQQKLNFATPGKQGDIIDVELGMSGIINISALSYIQLESYNGNIANGSPYTIANLVNIQLLANNRFRASFVAPADFTAVQVRLGGIASVAATLDIYGAFFRLKEAEITGAATPICEGQSTTLVATSTTAGIFAWYESPTSTTALSLTNTYITGPLTQTTTYYVQATRGICSNSVRQAVTITVLPNPIAEDILIATPLTASCIGEVVLSPTSTIVGVTFKYYADPLKTVQISDGTIDGITYSINTSTGALGISGLVATGSPHKYYIAVENSSACENAINTLKEVIVNVPLIPVLNVVSPLIACEKANLKEAIQNFDDSGNTIYTFFDASNNPITVGTAANVTLAGDYFIQVQSNGEECTSAKKLVTVAINLSPTLVVGDPVTVAAGTSVALSATSNGTLAWFDPQGNPLPTNPTVTLTAPGTYAYTVVASNANCSKTGTFFVNITAINTCQFLTERVYATSQSSDSIVTGTVSNGNNAVDGDVKTYSTITTGFGLLGIGTTWQYLNWTSSISKGTPVTIKLGSTYNGVVLGQNLSVIGTKNGVDIGSMQAVSGASLNLLAGDNSFEFTFVPSDATGPQDYDGIKIQSSSLLSVAQNTKVYDAYYTKSVTAVACTSGDIQDVLYGAFDLGVGVATATVGVSDAWNITNQDIANYATMYSGAGILAAADLTAVFKTPTIASDTLRIIISKPAVLLTASVLKGFTIQCFLGNVPVGAPIDNTSSTLNVKLFDAGSSTMAVTFSQPEAYDRVSIRFGGTLDVLDFLRVHIVERIANTKVIGSDINNKVIVCPGVPITLLVPEESCAKYIWYDSSIGGNIVATGGTYTLPAGTPAGIYRFYVQAVRYNCATLSRGEVIVEVRATTPAGTIANITVNGKTDALICSPTGSVTLQTSLANTPLLTNPIYHWYKFDGVTSQLIVGEIGDKLEITGLIPGTYTYYVGVSSDVFCETAVNDRKGVTFTILPPSKATDVSVSNTAVCFGVAASLTPTSILINPIFYWYLDSDKTQPITNGTTADGVAYAISTTGVLTVTGLTKIMSPKSYYVTVSSDASCENLAGDLSIGTIIINDPDTPTTQNSTQSFCLTDSPTFASIQANESNVSWYKHIQWRDRNSFGYRLDNRSFIMVQFEIWQQDAKVLFDCKSL